MDLHQFNLSDVDLHHYQYDLSDVDLHQLNFLDVDLHQLEFVLSDVNLDISLVRCGLTSI